MADVHRRSQKLDIPPQTPKWAVTIAFLSSNILIAFGVFYAAVSSDVKAYLGNRREIELASIAASQERSRQSCESLLGALGSRPLEGVELYKAVSDFLNEQAETRRRLKALNDEREKLEKQLRSCDSQILSK